MDPIKITKDGEKAILEKMALKEGAIGLRLKVGATGCSGHSYIMEHVSAEDDVSADDKFTSGDAVLYVPKINSWMLFGIEIGFEANDMSSGFTFTNPNESGRCGCGESFSVDRPSEQ